MLEYLQIWGGDFAHMGSSQYKKSESQNIGKNRLWEKRGKIAQQRAQAWRKKASEACINRLKM